MKNVTKLSFKLPGRKQQLITFDNWQAKLLNLTLEKALFDDWNKISNRRLFQYEKADWRTCFAVYKMIFLRSGIPWKKKQNNLSNT